MPVFVVDKPLGPTSHDVVARARRTLGTRRVGHAGTLDPLATGVLVVLSEGATKLSPFLTASDKSYLAWIAFGVGSATLDGEGPVTEIADADDLTVEQVAAALPPFLDLTEQLPPRHSAVQVAGVRSYAAARRGDELELPPRPVAYRGIELLAFAHRRDDLPQRIAPASGGAWRAAEGGRAFDLPDVLAPAPTAILHVHVAAGTYIRSFARDLGVRLGLPAHLSGLVRTRAGAAQLEDAVPLDELGSAPAVDAVGLLPVPAVAVGHDDARAVRDGRRLPASWQGRVALVDPSGALVAVADADEGTARYLRVWRDPP